MRLVVLVVVLIGLYSCNVTECVRKSIPGYCKSPNEGCRTSSECCSDKCVLAHPGTDPRCTKLTLHKPCLFTYECQPPLKCGKKNVCCAQYWYICSRAQDCCDPLHICTEVEGFHYKRCLFSANKAGKKTRCSSWNCVFLWEFVAASFVIRGRR